jgi:hypothetical protein
MLGFLTRSVLIAALAAVAPQVSARPPQTGTISGLIQDTSGAVMPGVTVTITSQDRGLTRMTVTDDLANGRVEPGRFQKRRSSNVTDNQEKYINNSGAWCGTTATASQRARMVSGAAALSLLADLSLLAARPRPTTRTLTFQSSGR